MLTTCESGNPPPVTVPSIEGEIDRWWLIEEEKGKKKKRKRRKKKYLASSLPAHPCRSHRLRATFVPARGDVSSPRAGRETKATLPFRF
ncbi:hypothetical protein GW17_00053388 [Ensete ventricosum]|nr:hypothetical protein GW17_00053388 [Ensete ventricosum]